MKKKKKKADKYIYVKRRHPVVATLVVFGKMIKWLIFLLLTIILLGLVTAYFTYGYAKDYIEDVIIPQAQDMQVVLDAQAVDSSLSSTILYLDSDGEYQVLDTLYGSENRIWVSYEDLPENLINATVAIEDKRFWEHEGVDWKRTAAAVVYMFTGQDLQGGATITQQLIINLSENTDVTVKRKVLEIFTALEYDSTHSKEAILENYLNYIYLGRQCYGVYTAAYKYFDKDVSELTLAECACLISITNNPSIYDPINHPENNKKRAATVLKQMYIQGYITEEEEIAAMAEIGYLPDGGEDEDGYTIFTYHEEIEQLEFYTGVSQTLEGASTSSDINSWYEDALFNEVKEDLMETFGITAEAASIMLYHGGLTIYSCLDSEVQAKVDAIYNDEDFLAGYESASGQSLISAITVVENSTGRVVAIADSEEKTVNRGQINATDAKKQPGSSIKPLSVYAPAIEEGLITPYSTVDDTPYMLLNDSAWPRNSSGSYTGLTTVFTSVIKSTNTSAVKTLDLLGITTSYDYLENRFGISTLVSYMETSSGSILSDMDYGALALGGLTNGVTTYEMAGAYSVFARNGIYIKPHMYTVVLDKDGNVLLSNEDNETGTVAISEDTNYYMNAMLTAVVTSGTGTKAQISGMTVAGKTGTTTNDYDRWFCGYTGYYTAAVWTGYTYSEKITASGNPSVTIWQEVMSSLVEGLDDIPLVTTSKETVTASYCTKSGLLATKACSADGCSATGTYIKGDAPTDYCTVHTTVQVCTECEIGTTGQHYLAGEYCPEECIEEVSVLVYERGEVASSVVATDSYQLLSWLEEQGECTLHTEEWVEMQALLSVQEIFLVAICYDKVAVDADFNLNAYSLDGAGNDGGKLSYSSSNTSVAKVDSSGNVTIKKAGTAEITITAKETDYAEAVTVTVTITVTEKESIIDVIENTISDILTPSDSNSGDDGATQDD